MNEKICSLGYDFTFQTYAASLGRQLYPDLTTLHQHITFMDLIQFLQNRNYDAWEPDDWPYEKRRRLDLAGTKTCLRFYTENATFESGDSEENVLQCEAAARESCGEDCGLNCGNACRLLQDEQTAFRDPSFREVSAR